MAADSLFGGGADLSQTLDQSSLDLINRFLTDTVGGTAVTESVGGSTVVMGAGHDGESQGALIPSGSFISGAFGDGVLTLGVQLPEGLGFVFEGKNNATPGQVGDFLTSIVDSYIPAGQLGSTGEAQRESLLHAINDLVTSIEHTGVDHVVVRMVDFLSGNLPQGAAPGTGQLDVSFNAASSQSGEAFAFNLGGLNTDQTLVLQGLDYAIVSGAGSVRIAGDSGVRITSDNADQHIIGGGGADTLVGGGGHDTLTGGAGHDVFGFSHDGKFEITDFDIAQDSIAFNVGGVHTLGELAPLITAVSQTEAGVTYEFGSHGSITLVGLSAAELTADLIKFNF